ncbi:hypothetical protein PPL_11986 [Heterostelium album PN500]|uniref:Uncharacterized protein n=1 Tax=Heterostelium pallidum (strain ATCC 26659 / Pp 5 / PN500) TaxID=670386 RepID=D3BV14_HETP5|nr:hypothetical protein PPL_11986 [Heterostelium album PN500]EFA74952.1 hypothetical protein PPL_11986 [Heterostelium album PN500]|eukprot:XP_020427086.1 hypothetical protein PPL_11986 [Heterostelium album PN500]
MLSNAESSRPVCYYCSLVLPATCECYRRSRRSMTATADNLYTFAMAVSVFELWHPVALSLPAHLPIDSVPRDSCKEQFH